MKKCPNQGVEPGIWSVPSPDPEAANQECLSVVAWPALGTAASGVGSVGIDSWDVGAGFGVVGLGVEAGVGWG